MTLLLNVTTSIISFFFLIYLPFRSLDSLLRIFNQVWHTGILPDSWKEAIVISIPKPGKDSTDPVNYRSIALTSCICKTMERMVNDRLVCFLEKNKLIATVQSGFRKQRGTVDHFVRFETFIREAFIKMIEWCFTPLLTVFQSYHGDSSHYSCFPGFHQY